MSTDRQTAGDPMREAWLVALRESGVSDEELAAAQTDEDFLLLAFDRFTVGEARYTEAEIAQRAGLDIEWTRRLYRALGVPAGPPDERAFTDDDLEALMIVKRLLDGGLVDEELVLQLTRVTGSSMARIAEAQIDGALDWVRAGHGLLTPDAGGLADFPEIMEIVWRRQLRAAARRHMAMGMTGGETRRTVGFADLVGFTALSQQLEDHELANVVDRFEALAYDTVGSLGGRVVKMIGDEVMFTVDDVRVGVEIALCLAETYHDDESLSDVRVGLACGAVLEREGDLYGPTVNLASRIVAIAYGGSVVVSADVHDGAADDEGLRWKSLRTRHLKDIGRVQLWTVRRKDDDSEGVFERARRRRSAIRDRVTDVIDRSLTAGEDALSSSNE